MGLIPTNITWQINIVKPAIQILLNSQQKFIVKSIKSHMINLYKISINDQIFANM